MSAFDARRDAFAKLHERGCFVIPNPWDAGSARRLAGLGFAALATTSAGFAFSRGLPDAPDSLSLGDVLDHVREVANATSLPVNADFQAGYSDDAQGVFRNVGRCIDAGVAGLSIEDARAGAERLHPIDEAVERMRAARRAIDASGARVMLTGRAECFLTGHAQPLEESIRRLKAYAEAGADVLYAPGVRDAASIRALVEAVAPKPLNVLVNFATTMRVGDLAALGVRRVSVGSTLARVALTAFDRAAGALARGEFAFGELLSMADVNRWFARG